MSVALFMMYLLGRMKLNCDLKFWFNLNFSRTSHILEMHIKFMIEQENKFITFKLVLI